MRRYVLAVLIVTLCVPAFAQQWVAIHAPQFTVVTDAGEKRGREIGQRFEEVRAGFGLLFDLKQVNIAAPLTIFAFRDPKQFRQFAPSYGKTPGPTGLFRSASDASFIVLDDSAQDSISSVLPDFVQLLIAGNLPPMPPWYDEGFADYCASLKVTKKQVELGSTRQEYIRLLETKPWIHILQVFAVRQGSPEYKALDPRMFAAEAWLAVHYLMANHLGTELNQFLDLTQNQGMGMRDAIRKAFGVEPLSFENAVHYYFTMREFKYFRAPTPADFTAGPYTARNLNESDWLANMANLEYHWPGQQDQGLELFQKILKTDPQNATANRGLGYVYFAQNDFAQAATYLERAAAADPDDGRTQYLIALVASRVSAQSGKPPADLAAIEQHLKAAIAANPANADAYRLLSWAEALDGNRDEARTHIEKAVALDPRNETYALTLVQFEMEAKQYEKARPLLNHLEGSRNPEVARYADQALQSIGESERAPITSARDNITAPQWRVSPAMEQAAEKAADNKAVAEGQVKTAPIEYLTGELVSVDCSQSPSATITFAAKGKRWSLFTPDRNKLVLINAEGFSCTWKHQNASANYRLLPDGRRELVSLEID